MTFLDYQLNPSCKRSLWILLFQFGNFILNLTTILKLEYYFRVDMRVLHPGWIHREYGKIRRSNIQFNHSWKENISWLSLLGRWRLQWWPFQSFESWFGSWTQHRLYQRLCCNEVWFRGYSFRLEMVTLWRGLSFSLPKK